MQTTRELPKSVRNEITDPKYIALEEQMYKMFGLSDAQIMAYGDILLQIILGNQKVLDLPDLLSRIPDAKTIDVRRLALTIALERLWPISFYLADVDTLIKRLGGTVPSVRPQPKVESDEEEGAGGGASVGRDWFAGAASEILSEFRSFNDLYLTQKPLKDDDDRLKAPTLTNWLADYLHTMGASGGSSLKRSQYMSKSRNVASLNSDEKKNLINFLVSYEESTSMYWHVAEDKYLLVEQELPGDYKKEAETAEHEHDLPRMLSHFEKIKSDFERIVNEKRQGLEVEIAGDPKRLYDIAWEALGFGETDRCIAALGLLIERHALNDMLKTDRRYIGIVARDIEARFGLEAKNLWDKDLGKQVAQSIFWRLVLADKLGLEEERAAIAADYLSKKLETPLSPIILDLKRGAFLFRSVIYKDKHLQYAEEV